MSNDVSSFKDLTVSNEFDSGVTTIPSHALIDQTAFIAQLTQVSWAVEQGAQQVITAATTSREESASAAEQVMASWTTQVETSVKSMLDQMQKQIEAS